MNDKKPIAIIAAILVLFVIGGGWWLSRRPAPAANTSPRVVTSTEAPIDKPAPPPVDLPPRDGMDAFLRPLLAALSSRAELARWIATDDLVGQLAAAVEQAAAGNSPARDFKVVKPATPFPPPRGGARRVMDPAGYRRYDGLVQTVTSIDASAVAGIYKTIRPRLNEAYRGMGHGDGDIDRDLHKALAILLDTPVVKDPIVLAEGGAAGWAYDDDELEALEPTQKQLLRMGAAHVDALLVWLRALQNALQ
jgi:hypothetical protein